MKKGVIRKLPEFAQRDRGVGVEHEIGASDQSLTSFASSNTLACLMQSHQASRTTSIDGETWAIEVKAVRNSIGHHCESVSCSVIDRDIVYVLGNYPVIISVAHGHKNCGVGPRNAIDGDTGWGLYLA